MTFDLQAILRGLLKGMTVVELRASEDGAEFYLQAPDGRIMSLKLRPEEAQPADLRVVAPEPPSAAPEAKEAAPPPAVAPVEPTVMARKGAVDFTPTFRMIRSMPGWQKLPTEPKRLLSELEVAHLQLGDDVELVAGARKAVAGDVAQLRDLLQRRAPSARAGPTPADAH